jgi:branched-chain amino acid transport system permease protein
MFLQLLLNGIVQGSLLALICIGYSLAYGSARVLNFAHADVMIAGGGYLVLFLIHGDTDAFCSIGMPLLFGLAGGIAGSLFLAGAKMRPFQNTIASIGFGAVIAAGLYLIRGRLPFGLATLMAIPLTGFMAVGVYRIGYLPLLRKDAPRNSILPASFDISIALESLLLLLWGSERRVFPPAELPSIFVVRSLQGSEGFFASVFNSGLIPIFSTVAFPVRDIVIVGVFGVAAIALAIFFRKSRIADAIVATGDNQLAARACGIPIALVLGHTFFVGGAIAALGGTFYVLRSASLDPMSGFTPGILAFVACVLGGIGSLRGSIAGAFLIGLVTSLAPGIPSAQWASNSLPASWIQFLPSFRLGDWSYGVAYVLMIVTVLLRPKGLFTR